MYVYIYVCVPLFFIYLFIYKSNSLVDLIYLTYLSIYLFIYTSYPKGIHFCGFKMWYSPNPRVNRPFPIKPMVQYKFTSSKPRLPEQLP